MPKIVKEPFAPKRRKNSRLGLWETLFAVLSLVFLRTQRPI